MSDIVLSVAEATTAKSLATPTAAAIAVLKKGAETV
jgi:hypothetical protein